MTSDFVATTPPEPERERRLDQAVLAIGEACSLQALAERSHAVLVPRARSTAKKPNHRHRRLLRARRERPRSRTDEKRDEAAPLHSITPSAVICMISGTVRPSVFAVLRLMASSNFTVCWTGKSAGFSPLRMRPA